MTTLSRLSDARSDQYRRPRTRIVIPDRVAERAATRCEEDENGCWISTYSTGSHGYAQIGWKDGGDRHMVTAHRAAWVHVHGQIPEGQTIDHLCRVPRCVRPKHLRELSNFDNARRTGGRDWELGQCINGHPDSELVHWGGKWKCRPCTLENQRRYRSRRAKRITA